MSEMVERARQIIANGCGCDRACEEMNSLDVYCGCRNDALKVLELFRIPTHKMVMAGFDQLDCEHTPHAIEDCWSAMITAALSSEKE